MSGMARLAEGKELAASQKAPSTLPFTATAASLLSASKAHTWSNRPQSTLLVPMTRTSEATTATMKSNPTAYNTHELIQW